LRSGTNSLHNEVAARRVFMPVLEQKRMEASPIPMIDRVVARSSGSQAQRDVNRFNRGKTRSMLWRRKTNNRADAQPRENHASSRQDKSVSATFPLDDPQFKERCKEALQPRAGVHVCAGAGSWTPETGMRHFDVQLIGGIVLHEGKIAEMKTGRRQDAGRDLARRRMR